MEAQNHLNALHRAQKQTSLAEIIQKLEETCSECNPLTPISCVGGCKTWKLKNQLRTLNEKTKSPDFITKLLNTLKNKRRLQVLETISKQRHSTQSLQQELRELGLSHSRRTIVQEYVNPLIESGLAEEKQNFYYATLLGHKVSELMHGLPDFSESLPPHSECYEEITMNILEKGPKTFADVKSVIPARSVARVLNRLKKASLIMRSKEKNYIFFFRTKRDANQSTLSPTETRVYENIPLDGISARRLAEKTTITLRRTYKYLRKLKGKKLVFYRRIPVSYELTAKGKEMTALLDAVRKLVLEISVTTAQITGDKGATEQFATGAKNESITPLTVIKQSKHT
jgi:predicted transcriptional regulator